MVLLYMYIALLSTTLFINSFSHHSTTFYIFPNSNNTIKILKTDFRPFLTFFLSNFKLFIIFRHHKKSKTVSRNSRWQLYDVIVDFYQNPSMVKVENFSGNCAGADPEISERDRGEGCNKFCVPRCILQCFSDKMFLKLLKKGRGISSLNPP